MIIMKELLRAMTSDPTFISKSMLKVRKVKSVKEETTTKNANLDKVQLVVVITTETRAKPLDHTTRPKMTTMMDSKS